MMAVLEARASASDFPDRRNRSMPVPYRLIWPRIPLEQDDTMVDSRAMPPVDAALTTAREAAEQQRGYSTLGAVLLGTAWVLVCTLLQLERQTGVPAHDSIWAEDGHLFLTTALNHPQALSLILAPAGEYMHLVPRTLAVIASALPIPLAAPFFAFASAILVGILSVFVYVASARLIPSRMARGALVVFMVLLPAARFEVANNAANLHYYLLFASFWALLHRPQSVWGTVAGCLVVLAATMSDPSAALLSPLAIWAFVGRERPLHRAIPVAFAIGLLVQIVVVAGADARYLDGRIPAPIREEIADRTYAPRAYGGSNPFDLPRLYGLRVVGALVIGDRFIEGAWRLLGWAIGYAGLVLVAFLLAYCVSKKALKHRRHTLIAFAYSIAFFAFPVWVRGTEHVTPSAESFSFGASRFVVVPMLLLGAALAMFLSEPDPRLGKSTWRFIQGTTLLLTAWLVLTNYAAVNFRSGGPSWSQEVAAAAKNCRISGPVYARIPVAPSFTGNVFNVLVSCARLQSDVEVVGPASEAPSVRAL